MQKNNNNNTSRSMVSVAEVIRESDAAGRYGGTVILSCSKSSVA